jgi:hypothetical protein
MSQVKSFKLRGGEEVVAEVVEERSGSSIVSDGLFSNSVTVYVLRRPHILQFQPVGPGQVGLAFVPWTLSNPMIEKLDLPAEQVVVTFAPSENVERQYLEQTSGISLAKPGFKM